MGSDHPAIDDRVRHRPVGRRLLLIVWIGLGVVVWNGVFDLLMTRGVKEYLYRQAAHELGRGERVTMREIMDETMTDAAVKASIWAVLVAGAGILTVIAVHPLIYDWNGESKPAALKPRVLLDDETLRDGLQSPSVTAPSIEQKLKILHLMEDLGIDTADIGLPGAGAHVVRDVERLAREIAGGMRIQANCAARTVIGDIEPIAEISQKVGLSIECCAFIGSSPIRQYAEGWTRGRSAAQNGRSDPVCGRPGTAGDVRHRGYDPRRSRHAAPAVLDRHPCRARHALCVSDTVGHATPTGAAAVVRFIAGVARECGSDAGIDWHGHRDRDLAIMNTIAAIDAGATRVHGTALGIGERVGNTPMDLLLVNLVLMGYLERDLTRLGRVHGGRRRVVRSGDAAELSGARLAMPFERRPASTPRRSSRPSGKRTRSSPTRCIRPFPRAWSAASRRSRSVPCRAART